MSEATIKAIEAKELEVNGRPTVENAAAWVKSIAAQIRQMTPYDQYYRRPEKAASMRMAQNALWCGAVLCRSMCIETEFGGYMPLNSVGYEWFHKLGSLAYHAGYEIGWDAWEVQIKNNAEFAKAARDMAGDVQKQWSNSEWVYDFQTVVIFAVGRFMAGQ